MIAMNADMRDRFVKLIAEGLQTDGGEHKQWFLWELARELYLEGMLLEFMKENDYDYYDKGIAP